MTAPILSEAPASAQITLRNLVISRWVLLALVLMAALLELVGAAPDSLAAWVPAAEHPLVTFATLAAWAGHNGLSTWLLRRGRASESWAGLHLPAGLAGTARARARSSAFVVSIQASLA